LHVFSGIGLFSPNVDGKIGGSRGLRGSRGLKGILRDQGVKNMKKTGKKRGWRSF
jgi:hypothetical protein